MGEQSPSFPGMTGSFPETTGKGPPSFPPSRGNVPGRERRRPFISQQFLRSRQRRSRSPPDTLEATEIKRSRVPGPSSYKERGASGMLPLLNHISAAGTAVANR